MDYALFRYVNRYKVPVAISLIFIILSSAIVFLSIGIVADEKAISWLKRMQDPLTGLLESYQDDENKWGRDLHDGRLGYLYDQALGIIAFTKSGEYKRAKKIIEGLVNIQRPDGSWYDGFWTDLPLNSHIDTIVVNHARRKYVGANAWTVLAILHYTIMKDDTTFIRNAQSCARWIISQQIVDVSDPNYGACRGGVEWDAEGDSAPPVTATWISTESNCDAHAALKHLGMYLGDNYYIEKADLIKTWVFTKAWNQTELRFNSGGGSREDEVLDVQTFAFLAFVKDSSPAEREKLNRGIEWVKNNLRENFSYSSLDSTETRDFSGFRFGRNISWGRHIDTPHIWWEGTAQLVKVFSIMNDLVNKEFYLRELISVQDNNGGIAYSFNPVGIQPEWPCNLPYNSVAATAWFYLNHIPMNPLVVNFRPNIQRIKNFIIPEGFNLRFKVAAKDLNNDTLLFSATNLPPGATFDPVTGIFRWTPTNRQGGYPYIIYKNIRITVSDGEYTNSAEFFIRVVDGASLFYHIKRFRRYR